MLNRAKQHLPGPPGAVYKLKWAWTSFCAFRGTLGEDLNLEPSGDTICRHLVNLAEHTKREGRGHGPDKTRKYNTFVRDISSLFTTLRLNYDEFVLSSREKSTLRQTADLMLRRDRTQSKTPSREKQYATLDDAAYCVEAAFAAVLDNGSSINDWVLSSFIVLLLASTGLRSGDIAPSTFYDTAFPDFQQLKQFSLLFSDIRIERCSEEYEEEAGPSFLMRIIVRNSKGRKDDPGNTDKINIYTKVGDYLHSRDVVLFFLIYAIRLGACTFADVQSLGAGQVLAWKADIRNLPVLHQRKFSSAKTTCMMASSVSRRVSVLTRNAGIVAQVTGHDFRRGFIRVSTAEKGLQYAMEQVGHQNRETTRRYQDSVRTSTVDPTEIMNEVSEKTKTLRRKALTDSGLVGQKKKARLSVEAAESRALKAMDPGQSSSAVPDVELVDFRTLPVEGIWDEIADLVAGDDGEEARNLQGTYTNGEHLETSKILMQAILNAGEGLLCGTTLQFLARFAELESSPPAHTPWTIETAMEYHTFFCGLCDAKFHCKE